MITSKSSLTDFIVKQNVPANNAVLVRGPGTVKTHLATAIGVRSIHQHRSRVRFLSTIELANPFEKEEQEAKHERIANRLMGADLVILDELGYLPFSQSGGALLFHLISKLYEKVSLIIATLLKREMTALASNINDSPTRG
jgi:DNA replication protein DnaC